MKNLVLRKYTQMVAMMQSEHGELPMKAIMMYGGIVIAIAFVWLVKDAVLDYVQTMLGEMSGANFK